MKSCLSLSALQRDSKGRILRGVAQNTNKNNSAGRPCFFCAHYTYILKITGEYFEGMCSIENGIFNVPFLEELALLLGTSCQNIYNWSIKKSSDGSLEHPEFFDAIQKIKMLQRLRLQQRCLTRWNPTGAIFLLKINHGFTTNTGSTGVFNAKPWKVEIIE